MDPVISLDPRRAGLEDLDEQTQTLALAHGYAPDLPTATKDEILTTAETEAELDRDRPIWPVWPK